MAYEGWVKDSALPDLYTAVGDATPNGDEFIKVDGEWLIANDSMPESARLYEVLVADSASPDGYQLISYLGREWTYPDPVTVETDLQTYAGRCSLGGSSLGSGGITAIQTEQHLNVSSALPIYYTRYHDGDLKSRADAIQWFESQIDVADVDVTPPEGFTVEYLGDNADILSLDIRIDRAEVGGYSTASFGATMLVVGSSLQRDVGPPYDNSVALVLSAHAVGYPSGAGLTAIELPAEYGELATVTVSRNSHGDIGLHLAVDYATSGEDFEPVDPLYDKIGMEMAFRTVSVTYRRRPYRFVPAA